MMLFAKDFFYSFIAFGILVSAGAAISSTLGILLGTLMVWLSVDPLAAMGAAVAVVTLAFAVSFAIHEHRKRGGR